jgi:hypothetical protein
MPFKKKEWAGQEWAAAWIPRKYTYLATKSCCARPEPNGVIFQFHAARLYDPMGAFLNSKRHDRRDNGTLKYFPDDPSKGFIYPTSTDNIVKMWHSQESIWNLMESHAKRQGIRYTRVAMLRFDVLFVTHIDIYAPRNISLVIPAFSKWPVNDRMAYGNNEAVKLWATGRFANIERHLNNTDHW